MNKLKTECVENSVRRTKVGSKGLDKVPHLSKIEYHGMEFPILITVPGRPPLCLKCHLTGHVRYECDAKSQLSTWAARASGARAGAFTEVDLEEGDTEEERKEKIDGERRKKREGRREKEEERRKKRGGRREKLVQFGLQRKETFFTLQGKSWLY